MGLRPTLILAAASTLLGLQSALAQMQSAPLPFPSAPQQQQPQQPLPFPSAQPPQQQQQQNPPCIKEFSVLRDDAEKKAAAIHASQKHKVSPQVACRLLTDLATSQNKMLKFAKAKEVSCGIPKQVIDQINKAQEDVGKARTRICAMAATPQRPAGPSLSDVLGGSSVPDSENVKSGHGTFDTLSGSPLVK